MLQCVADLAAREPSLVHILQGHIVYCSVLQCAAVCCSVSQCAAVCCSVLQCVSVCCIPCSRRDESGQHSQKSARFKIYHTNDSLQRGEKACNTFFEFVRVKDCTAGFGEFFVYVHEASACFATCCSVLHCRVAYCSVLQCVAVCCSVLQCVAMSCTVLHCVVAMCCSVLRSVLLQCVAVCCGIICVFALVEDMCVSIFHRR